VEPLLETVNRASETDRQRCEEYLAEASKRVGQEWDGSLSTQLTEGHAGQEVVAEADAWNADVIVLATHGRGGIVRAWMGSVADYCIRTAAQPLMAIRPPAYRQDEAARPLATSQVVVPLDGSWLAEAALPYGAALAKQFGVPLALIRSVHLPMLGNLSDVPDTMDPSTPASQYLKEQSDRLADDGVEVTEHVVADGAAHAILAQAKGDLVVMSTHGRTGVHRVLLGSVADKVVRGATGAVLVIHSRAHL
jgi:nucleotide-binding universal stress UspA family protein